MMVSGVGRSARAGMMAQGSVEVDVDVKWMEQSSILNHGWFSALEAALAQAQRASNFCPTRVWSVRIGAIRRPCWPHLNFF